MEEDDSLAIEFPVSFHVSGTPVSLQASARSKGEWKNAVLEACNTVLAPHKFATDSNLSVTIYDFPTDEPSGDVDNIIKPILDALEGRIYVDDAYIKRVVVQRFLDHEIKTLDDVPDLVGQALVNDPPFVYILVNDNPLREAL